MIRRPPRSTLDRSSAASDVYKRKVHNASTILADLKRTDYPETVWGRFNVGRDGTIRWYRRVHDRLRELGFDAAIMRELNDVARALETWGPDSTVDGAARTELASESALD